MQRQIFHFIVKPPAGKGVYIGESARKDKGEVRKLTDQEIIQLYWRRDDQAVAETDRKYGRFCHAIAGNILRDVSDAEEVVNDCWWKTWDSIPPQYPDKLPAFLGRITRNLALSRLKGRSAQKRGGGEVLLALDELGECIPSPASPQQEAEARELAEYIDAFLSRLDQQTRNVFLSRYWYFASLEDIAVCSGFSRGKVKTMLFRTRKKLLTYLKEEGLC